MKVAGYPPDTTKNRLLLLRLDHSLHNFRLLNQERSENAWSRMNIKRDKSDNFYSPLLHTISTSWATIRTTNGLLCLRDSRVLARSEGRNLCTKHLSTLMQNLIAILINTYTWEGNTAVSTFGCSGELTDVVVDELATRSLHNPSAVGSSVVWVALAESNALGHCGNCKRQIFSNTCYSSYNRQGHIQRLNLIPFRCNATRLPHTAKLHRDLH